MITDVCYITVELPIYFFQVEYIKMPGWKSTIESIRDFQKLPHEAQAYVLKVQELMGVPGNFVIL